MWTSNLLNMTMTALWSMPAKATRIVRAFIALFLRVNMAVRTLCIGALSILGEEEALRHAAIVDRVEVVAKVLLLAEPAEVMLAHNETIISGVAPLAAIAARATVRGKEKGTEVG